MGRLLRGCFTLLGCLTVLGVGLIALVAVAVFGHGTTGAPSGTGPASLPTAGTVLAVTAPLATPRPAAPPLAIAAQPTAAATPTVAYELATIQESQYVTPDDPLVGSFRDALAALAPKCQETVPRLSDYTVATHDVMAKAGVEQSYLSILQNVARSIPTSVGPMKCDEVFAAYATLRLHGPSQ